MKPPHRRDVAAGGTGLLGEAWERGAPVTGSTMPTTGSVQGKQRETDSRRLVAWAGLSQECKGPHRGGASGTTESNI